MGWPTEGTFHLPTILALMEKIFVPGKEGHPDQVPYIVTWKNLVKDPPNWLKPFLPPPLPMQVLTVKAAIDGEDKEKKP